MKGNTHRDLHHALTSGKISPEEYSKKIERFNRDSMRKMMALNMRTGPRSNAKDTLGQGHKGDNK
jgi:hypothetical protein